VNSPPVLGLGGLAGRYDAVVSDVWGVLHDGLSAFPDACAALARFRAERGPVVLLSNAPRPGDAVAAQLDQLGVPRKAWDAIVTSGDLVRAHLAADPWQWVCRVGPAVHNVTFAGLDLTFCDVEEADLLVVTGLIDDETETAEHYRPLLERALEYEVPLACANPDIVVERGEKLIPCAGAVAAIYEAIGGEVIWLGKPWPVAYEAALARLHEAAGGAVPASRVLAIGDAIRTDLAGAKAAGLDAMFIAGGIHAAEAGSAEAIDTGRLAELFRAAKLPPPVGVAWRLAW
jgi:HAD superfamily hydrolase (TIGR01459 family)